MINAFYDKIMENVRGLVKSDFTFHLQIQLPEIGNVLMKFNNIVVHLFFSNVKWKKTIFEKVFFHWLFSSRT